MIEGIELLGRIVTFDPSKRLSAAHAIEHKFFMEVCRRSPGQPSDVGSTPTRTAARAAQVRGMEPLPSIAACKLVVEKAKQAGKLAGGADFQ